LYERPTRLADALACIRQDGVKVMAGGTDLYPAAVGLTLPPRLLDLTAVAALRGIAIADGWVTFGAATTWTDILNASLPRGFEALKQAAREVGSIQIQNRGTIGGNLCNASPAADGVPPLLALAAEVELRSVRGQRRLAVADFITGYRRTALAADEILTAVLVPLPAAGTGSAFVKLGTRRYLVISVVMAAVVVGLDGKGAVSSAAVAVGAASPVARRLPALEAALLGRKAETLAQFVKVEHLAPLAPIDDIRAPAAYRLAAALEVVGAALDRAVQVAAHG
jgi:CO/xanthine dehydrogenase FAD-binding subunit